jgi:hypothetical protein
MVHGLCTNARIIDLAAALGPPFSYLRPVGSRTRQYFASLGEPVVLR